MRSSVADALQKLTADPAILFSKVLEHGSMSVEIYKPIATDRQTPHVQDELYVIISGSGDFYSNGERNPFVAGDVLFVAAGLNIVSKTLRMISQPGLFFTARRVAKHRDKVQTRPNGSTVFYYL